MSGIPPSGIKSGVVAKPLHQLRLFFVALQFFTRLPVPRWVGFDPAWLHQASRYFSAVGIVVGAATASIYWASAHFWSPAVAVLLSTVGGIYLTGAFHEDGFADVCDGFGGGYSVARILDIMKDSRVGAYGVIGIALMLGLKCTVLANLPVLPTVAGLLLAHPVSRWMASALIWQLSYVKAEGKAKPLADHMSTKEFGIAAILAALPVASVGLLGLLAWSAIATGLIFSALSTLWLARLFVKRIGGYTGDCLGAVQQLAEVMFYLGLSATMAHLR
ncbi:adenosylcobinamide-GDP ribazoletransferase [Glaciimonas immobilis]|uniref:Adenosylcobinamide-GDP ribazoletransferase n=1 Tax=Glaciimonas immobilis TaxID=728004 RepID=A0A840RXC9_9BURK|nr:adenosylcobinamide-GDP ribazoletransferase [Glaciimonas immobilis]KAF3996751.1 adenosylcobinamide-GDP ribazoletransferase [Glaciimonas immobilis]MBB5201324.1 adenosylcobinamide-GDP ribazoletransferase [Glaciimonas immobilis]